MSVFIMISHCEVCSSRHPHMATGTKNYFQASPAVVLKHDKHLGDKGHLIIMSVTLFTDCWMWIMHMNQVYNAMHNMFVLFKRKHSEYKGADGSGLRQIARVTPFVPAT
jgi:hypothetical protein